MVKIIVKDLSVNYESIEALKDVSFEVYDGEITGIIGPNGAGKTTLLRTLAGILKQYKGVIYIDGVNLLRFSSNERAKLIAYQGPETPQWRSAYVLDYIMTSRYPRSKGFIESEKDLSIIEESLKTVDALHLTSRRLSQLSSGEFQRVLIARLLSQEAKILLIDEPITHLDLYYQIEVLKILRNITRDRRLLTIITLHDLQLASMYCDKLILLNKGVIEAIGEPKEVLTRERISRTYNVNVDIKEISGKIIIIPIETLG